MLSNKLLFALILFSINFKSLIIFFFQTATAGADLVLRFLVRFKLLLLVDVEFLVIECWGELVLELSRRVLCGPV